MDSNPYSYETSIFTLGAPHEEVQGRQTKLHPGFTLGKLVQPSPGISILIDSHIVLSKRSKWKFHSYKDENHQIFSSSMTRSWFKKFKCLGDVLASVSLPEFATHI